MKLDPARDREYIKTLTCFKNTSDYRRMVIEQVGSKKSKRGIRRI
ncbi:MAG TPA: hypothetical protein PLO02_07785 [Tenuifilaceae bacterium]|nr:hypothetical protein [Bacteroidales bacterium]MDI9516158.1 hypothetical protein [Bacteroidota bacterium]HNV81746.1 hypothetical protein [Tenuifilaceae bacterium]HOF92247.1 hypothetical protein [Tenuifilaceae bacterium]HOM85679.1 hypothetical protein [Tenuifilaceae bacterium]